MSGKDLASPFAAIIASAAKHLPAQTGATQKAAVQLAIGATPVILADVSGSMAELAGSRRKIDVLQTAISSIRQPHRLLAFSNSVVEIPAGTPLPPPEGGTALHLALAAAAALKTSRLLVISDGHPDDPAAALRAARGDWRIDVLYCGPDNDVAGMAFMQRLARGGGTVRHHNLAAPTELLTQSVHQLLLEAPNAR